MPVRLGLNVFAIVLPLLMVPGVLRAAGAPVPVTFAHSAPGATTVTVIGDFTGWAREPIALETDEDGFRKTITLPPGTYGYMFVIDDRTTVSDAASTVRTPGPDGRLVSAVEVRAPANEAASSPARVVRFELPADGASRASVAGTFNNWNPEANELEREGDVFTAEIAVPVGEHQYKYVLDGSRWITDPRNPSLADDDVGGYNSELVVAAGDEPLLAQEGGGAALDDTGNGAIRIFRPVPSVEVIVAPDVPMRLRFTYVNDEPETVSVAGTFNRWDPLQTPMRREGSTWTAEVDADERRHIYKLVVGGEWQADPGNPNRESDGSGGFHSVLELSPEGLVGPSAARPGDGALDTLRIGHTPRWTRYFDPTGEPRVRVRVGARDATTVTAVAWPGIEPERTGLTLLPMRRAAGNAAFDWYECDAAALLRDGAYSYVFLIEDAAGEGEVHPEPSRLALTARGFVDDMPAGSLPDRLLLLEPGHWFRRAARSEYVLDVPEWASQTIWYNVFPERFRNGDPANDPVTSNAVRWTREWDIPTEHEGDSLYPRIFERRYGGDLAGVTEKLGYLSDLGVTGIWFNPVFQARSLHKYDATDFRHIDDTLGAGHGDYEETAAQGDLLDPATWSWSRSDEQFLVLLRDAKQRGIRIILDGVFNHTGTAHPAFTDIVRRGESSRYRGWYEIRDWGPPLQWSGWAGDQGLPVFREGPAGIEDPDLREHLFAITRRWMDPDGNGDPSDGIDGWRLDAAEQVEHGFWRDWRLLVKSINPDAFILGEIWEPPGPWLQADQFDAVMNYQWTFAVMDTFVNGQPLGELDERLALLRLDVPAAAQHAMMNVLGSHDTDRVVSQLNNPGRNYDRGASRYDIAAGRYDAGKPPPDVYQKLKALVAWAWFQPGTPLIYYGDEAGMWGADDPNCRKPMLWKDLEPYDNPEENHVMEDVLEHHRRLAAARHFIARDHRAAVETLIADDTTSVMVYRRDYPGGRAVIVALNLSEETQAVTVASGGFTAWEDLLDADSYSVVTGMDTSVTLRRLPGAARRAFRATRDGELRLEIPPVTTRVMDGQRR